MGDFQAIDVGLGLMFIYLVLSLVCTGINEFLAGILQRRRRNLLKGLEYLLAHNDHSNLLTSFQTHPFIKSLYGKNFQTSYVPPKIFSSVLLDLLHPSDSRTPTTLDDIQNTVDPVKDTAAPSILHQTLKLFAKESGTDINRLKGKIEEWYNEAMVGTSGRYRTKTQAIVFAIAVAVAFGANADTFQLIQTLSQDSAVRAALVTQIDKLPVKGKTIEGSKESAPSSEPKPETTPDPTSPTANGITAPGLPQLTLEDLEKTGLQLGWETIPPSTEELGFKKFMGLLITAIAISLGAPFWFDLLKKVANVRAGSLSPDEIEKQKEK